MKITFTIEFSNDQLEKEGMTYEQVAHEFEVLKADLEKDAPAGAFVTLMIEP